MTAGPKRRRGGRPSLLTRERHERIIAEYAQSRRLTYAAAAGGVSRSTLAAWRTRGTRAGAAGGDVWAEACILRSERTKTGKPRRAWWDAIERKLGVELDPYACFAWDLEAAEVAFGRAHLAAVREFERGIPKRDKRGQPIPGQWVRLPDLRAATWLLEHCAPELYGAAACRQKAEPPAQHSPREYAAAVAEFLREVDASIEGPPETSDAARVDG